MTMTGSIRGYVVRGASGVPLADATIAVVGGPAAAPDLAPLTGDSGWFALDGLAEGEWRLAAYGPLGERGEATVCVLDDAVTDVVIATAD
jgi:hypothetical protein